MIRVSAATALGLLGVLLGGCGERPQVLDNQEGAYKGKAHAEPFQHPPWNGDRTAWNRAIAARNQTQNEYRRTR